MGLRCKEGELAIRVTGSPAAHIPVGAIVRCVRFIGSGCSRVGDSSEWVQHSDLWRVEFRGSTRDPMDHMNLAVPDSHLRPLPGGEGEDEMLRIAGKPVPYEAPSPWEAITEEER